MICRFLGKTFPGEKTLTSSRVRAVRREDFSGNRFGPDRCFWAAEEPLSAYQLGLAALSRQVGNSAHGSVDIDNSFLEDREALRKDQEVRNYLKGCERGGRFARIPGCERKTSN